MEHIRQDMGFGWLEPESGAFIPKNTPECWVAKSTEGVRKHIELGSDPFRTPNEVHLKLNRSESPGHPEALVLS